MITQKNETIHKPVAEFYQSTSVADSYSAQRYSGSGGEMVWRRELGIVSRLLPRSGRILDVACGTGRLASVAPDACGLYGIDLSPAMLRHAESAGRYRLAAGDAFSLPFLDGSFDAVVALRLLFHFPDPAPVLAELARVVRPGGVVIFETCGWSPRSFFALDSDHWGPRIFVHGRKQIQHLLLKNALRRRVAVDAFLATPVLYRALPPFGVAIIERIESLLPPSFRCRTFWQASVTIDASSHGVSNVAFDPSRTRHSDGDDRRHGAGPSDL